MPVLEVSFAESSPIMALNPPTLALTLALNFASS